MRRIALCLLGVCLMLPVAGCQEEATDTTTTESGTGATDTTGADDAAADPAE